jgi:hypothetical protein
LFITKYIEPGTKSISNFTLNKFGDELIINLFRGRKSVFLPRFANYLELDGFEFKDNWLKVKLGKGVAIKKKPFIA